MRYSSIDLLRFFAILVMVIVHFGENLAGFTSPITGFGAPLFAFLSGVSYFLWVIGLESKGVSQGRVTQLSLQRALFVFAVGIAFNIIVWLPADLFNWDVLTFLGASLAMLTGARLLPRPVVVMIATLTLLISPLLRFLADYQAYWVNGYFECDWTFQETLIGFLATGYFPFFPWVCFSLTGYLLASLLIDASDAETLCSPRRIRIALWMGLIMMSVSTLSVWLSPFLPAGPLPKVFGYWKMFPPTLEYVLGSLGLSIVLLSIGIQWIEPRANSHWLSAILKIARRFSQYSFTVYVMHHMFHVWPLWVYGYWNGKETTEYWMKAVSLPTSMGLAAAYVVVQYGVLLAMGTKSRFSIEYWMRTLCDQPWVAGKSTESNTIERKP